MWATITGLLDLRKWRPFCLGCLLSSDHVLSSSSHTGFGISWAGHFIPTGSLVCCTEGVTRLWSLSEGLWLLQSRSICWICLIQPGVLHTVTLLCSQWSRELSSDASFPVVCSSPSWALLHFIYMSPMQTGLVLWFSSELLAPEACFRLQCLRAFSLGLPRPFAREVSCLHSDGLAFR